MIADAPTFDHVTTSAAVVRKKESVEKPEIEVGMLPESLWKQVVKAVMRLKRLPPTYIPRTIMIAREVSCHTASYRQEMASLPFR